MNRLFFFLVLVSLCFFTSCYTITHVSKAPYYQEMYIGATKLTIKQDLGVPSRVIHDEDLGEVLIYEKFTTQISGQSRTSAYVITDTGRSTTNNNYTSTEERSFVEFYFKEGTDACYQIKTNQVDVIKEKDKPKTTLTILGSVALGVLSFLTPFFAAGIF